jgi:hypothetical protein
MAVMSHLRKLDPNAKINWITGTVKTRGGTSAGSRLISGLQSSNNTVTIKSGSLGTMPKSREDAEKAGVGTDSAVFFSPNKSLGGNYYQKDGKGNLYKPGSSPLEIGLGHELIHGLHYAEGTGDNSSDDYSYILSGVLDGQAQTGTVVLSRSSGTGYPTEEAKTIGLGDYRNNSITENALRVQLGYDERVDY